MSVPQCLSACDVMVIVMALAKFMSYQGDENAYSCNSCEAMHSSFASSR